MKTALTVGLLLTAASLAGCQQEVLSETYRPMGVGQAQSMAGMMPLTGHVMPTQNLPRKVKEPWYRLTWLFGRDDKPVQTSPFGTPARPPTAGRPPALPPSQPVSVGVPNR